jgi:hypothetical protein
VRGSSSRRSRPATRAFLAAQKGTRDLAALLAEKTGDAMLPTVAAGTAERAHVAFGLIEKGLSGCAVKA